MRVSALFGAKHIKIFKIYGVFTWARGEGRLSQFGNFSNKGGGGQFFAILAVVLYGRPLML